MTSGLRDVEPIGSLQDYLTLHGEDYLSETADTTLPDIERCAGNVAAICEMCGEAGMGADRHPYSRSAGSRSSSTTMPP